LVRPTYFKLTTVTFLLWLLVIFSKRNRSKWNVHRPTLC